MYNYTAGMNVDLYQGWTLYNLDNGLVVPAQFYHPIYSADEDSYDKSVEASSMNDSGYESSAQNESSSESSSLGNVDEARNNVISPYFGNIREESLSEKILRIEVNLANHLCTLQYTDSGIKYISNPLDHAIVPHKLFLQKYLDGPKPVLFLGMNPGPWGMCQTGIPFGDVFSSREFLKVSGPMKIPILPQHPKRPVEGFACKRKEVSGSRFWGYFQKTCVTPQNFFKHCFVMNHCPLAFMKDSGKNVAPAEMNKAVKTELTKRCDHALSQILDLLGTKFIVGVGKFAEARAKSIIKENGLKIGVGSLMHPSPINPAANKGWNEIAEKSLLSMGLMPYLQPSMEIINMQ